LEELPEYAASGAFALANCTLIEAFIARHARPIRR